MRNSHNLAQLSFFCNHRSDSDRTIRNNLNIVPFEIAERRNGSGIRVEVSIWV